MSTSVLDQSMDTSGREMHRLSTLYPPPDFVKSASSEQLCGSPEALAPHMYGDPRRKMYPCHNAPATWMSAAFLFDKRADHNTVDFEMIEDRLQKAAEFHGIGRAFAELREKVSADIRDEEAGLSDDMFAVVYRVPGTTEKHRHLPLRNAAEVKTAAEYLKQYRDEFHWNDRQTMADKVLTKAAEYGASLPGLDDFLEKQAGRGVCSAAEAAAALRQRSMLTRNAEMREQIAKVAQHIEDNATATREPDTLHKLAKLFDDLDRELRVKYSDEIRRPEDILFSVTEKVASEFQHEHVPLTNGNVYKTADLSRIRIDDMRSWMGDDFVDAVTTGGVMLNGEKMAELLPTLPRPDAERFDRFLGEVGIYPFGKEAAHTGQRLTREQLFQLAEQHIG